MSRPKKRVRVVGVVGQQAAVRTHRARLRERHVLDQGRVLPQHRPLEIARARDRGRGRARESAPSGPGAGCAAPRSAARPGTAPAPAAPTGVRAAAAPRPWPRPGRAPRVPMPGAQGRLDVQLLRLQPQLVEAPRLDPAGVPAVQITRAPAPRHNDSASASTKAARSASCDVSRSARARSMARSKRCASICSSGMASR